MLVLAGIWGDVSCCRYASTLILLAWSPRQIPRPRDAMSRLVRTKRVVER